MNTIFDRWIKVPCGKCNKLFSKKESEGCYLCYQCYKNQ